MGAILDLDPPTAAYADELVKRLAGELGPDLTGVYLFGSAALDDYRPPRSDLDVAVVAARPLTEEQKARVAARLDHRELPCPARKLELVIYERDRLSRKDVSFELDLNTGPGLHEWRGEPTASPTHWFVLDVAIGRDRGLVVAGPPPATLFPEQDDEPVLDAIRESLDWHADHADEAGAADPADIVLNACRAWRFIEGREWASKSEAGLWAAARPEGEDVIRRALARREGDGPGPRIAEARAFASGVRPRAASSSGPA